MAVESEPGTIDIRRRHGQDTGAVAANPAEPRTGTERATPITEAGTIAAVEPAAQALTPRARLRFELDRDARYHQERAAHLDRWRRILDFALLLAGGAIVGEIAVKAGDLLTLSATQWLGLLVAAIGALQTVWEPGSRAAEHRAFCARYVALRGRMPAAQDGDLAAIDAEREAIENEEPGVFWWLEAHVWDETARAHGLAPTTFHSLGRVKRALRHWVRGSSAPLPMP